jgi:hypothetical protein
MSQSLIYPRGQFTAADLMRRYLWSLTPWWGWGVRREEVAWVPSPLLPLTLSGNKVPERHWPEIDPGIR